MPFEIEKSNVDVLTAVIDRGQDGSPDRVAISLDGISVDDAAQITASLYGRMAQNALDAVPPSIEEERCWAIEYLYSVFIAQLEAKKTELLKEGGADDGDKPETVS